MTALTSRPTTPTIGKRDTGGFRRRGTDFAVNASVLGLLWVAYSTVRGFTADEFTTAMVNAGELLRFQDSLGLPSELKFQRGLLGRTELLKAANVYYIAVHFPATVGFLAWVWLRHRDRFARVRNTLIGVTIVGLVLHVVYPLAPPRMVRGFVDTAATFGPNPYDLSMSTAANQIAAMPSLHVGWALLVAIGMIWLLNGRWRWLALIHPALTAGVVVITANHYWTDAIVAALLVGLGWLIFGYTRRPRDLAQIATDLPPPKALCSPSA